MLPEPPTLDELRRAFEGLLDCAIAEGNPTPTSSSLWPLTLDAIDDVARAVFNGQATDELIAEARRMFEKNEASRRARN